MKPPTLLAEKYNIINPDKNLLKRFIIFIKKQNPNRKERAQYILKFEIW